MESRSISSSKSNLHRFSFFSVSQISSVKMTRYIYLFKVTPFIFLPVVLLLSFVLVINTISAQQKSYSWDHAPLIKDRFVLDQKQDMMRAEKLAKSLKYQTISYEPGQQNFSEFLKLHDYIRNSMYHSFSQTFKYILNLFHVFFFSGFPLIHSSPFITLTVINGYSLLYKIEGSQPNATLPYMLAAHLDVVPVSDNWVYGPFNGI